MGTTVCGAGDLPDFRDGPATGIPHSHGTRTSPALAWRSRRVTPTAPTQPASEIDVCDFGAVGDGDSDCSTAIANAIHHLNALPPAQALKLTFPAGRYLVRSDLPLISHGDLVVSGYGAILDFSPGCTAGLRFHDESRPLANIQVRGLQLEATTKCEATAVKLLDVRFAVLEGLSIRGFSVGISVATFQYPMISNCNIDLCTHGVEVDFGDGLEIVNCRLNGSYGDILAQSKGIVFRRSIGALICQTDITRFELGISMEPVGRTHGDPWNYVSWTFLNSVLADSCRHGLHAHPETSGCVQGLFATNCWFSTNIGRGVCLANCSGTHFSACVMFNNGDWGGSFEACHDLRLDSCTIASNNRLDSSDSGGLALEACEGVAVLGSNFTNDGRDAAWKPAVQFQRMGLRIRTSVENIQVIANRFHGHAIDIEMPTALTPSRGVCRDNISDNAAFLKSAREIHPAIVHDVLHIGGTARIDDILTALFPNKELTLIVDDGCTIMNAFNFALAGDFVGRAGSTLVLRANTTTGKWGEISRAIV